MIIDIDKIIELKKVMEAEVLGAINRFENETRLNVTSIDCIQQPKVTSCGLKKVLYVKAVVELQ